LFQVDSELPASGAEELVEEFQGRDQAPQGVEFPTNPLEQLRGAIMAVFNSWENDRATPTAS